MTETRLKRLLPGIQDLPRHPVFEIAEQAPVFLVGDRVYSVGEGNPNDGDGFYREKKRIKSKKIALVEVGDLGSLDALLLDRAQPDIERIGEAYARGAQRKLNALRSLDGDLDVPQLILKQVFPYLQDGHYRDKVSQLLGIEEKRESSQIPQTRKTKAKATRRLEQIADEAEREVRSMMGQIEQEGQETEERTRKQSKLDSLLGYKKTKPNNGASFLGRALNGRNVAIVDGAVYDLVAGRDGSKKYVQINGQGFSLAERENLEEVTSGNRQSNVGDLESLFLIELGKRVRVDSLREHLSRDRIIDLLRTQDEELLEMAGRKKYRGEGFGFLQDKEGDYYVYIEVPAFAIKSQFDGNHYLFDKTRIGLRVEKDGQRIEGRRAELVMIDNNNHPFLHKQKGSFVRICTGDADLPTSGEDEGEVIAKRLRRGREILMFGYTGKNYNQEYLLKEGNKYFGKNRIELKKLKKMGVPIIKGGRKK